MFKVAAVAAYDTIFLRHTRGTNALVPIETLSAILGSEGGYSEILIKPAQGVETSALQKELTENLPDNYTVIPVVNDTEVESGARQKSMPFFLISFFSLTMSVFIIFSSYKVIALERLPFIGTFRSIGATEKTVTNILMLESLVYGGLGAIIGVPMGLIVLRLLLRGLGNSLSQGIEIPMVVSLINIVLACSVALVVSVLSAWIPIRRASRLPVKDVVLGMVEEEKDSNIKLFLVGAILFVLSIILPRVGQRLNENVLLITGGFSLIGLLAATVIIIPMLTNGVSHLLEHAYGAIIGNEGRLAARNMRGNKNTSQNITLLFISISAVIAISVVGSFVQVYIGDVFRGAELDGFIDATISTELLEKIEQIDGIDEVLPVHVMNNMISVDDLLLSRVEGTNDIAQYEAMFAMKYDIGSDSKPIQSAFGTGRNILLSTERMANLGVKSGDALAISANGQEYEYIVIGSYKIRSTNTDAIIPSSYAVSDFGTQNYGIIAYVAANPDSVMVQIHDLLGNSNNWSRTVEEFNHDAMGTVGAFLAPIKNLTWFILLLAVVGIINKLLINSIQKRRAKAMYKSVGMSDWQNIRITLVESFSSGVIGAVIGIFVSWMEIKTIFLVAGPRIAMEPELMAGTFLLAGALGVGITLVGSIVPIIKTRNIKIVEELKFD